MNTINMEIAAVLPELYLVMAAFILLLFGVYRSRQVTPFFLFSTAIALLCAALITGESGTPRYTALNDLIVNDGFAVFAKLLILAATALSLLISTPWLQEEGGRPFEYILLMLFSAVGAMLMVSSNDLISVYVSLELMSLCLYVMASFARDNLKSTEAGLKYFVLGALASGMLLFGASLIYGFAGSTNFEDIMHVIASGGEEGASEISRAVVVGLVFVIIGFCFKVSAVPFHMWTPDVYEGAPTPVTAYFATVPKIAGLVLLIRVLLQPFGDFAGQWQQIILFASVASLFVGALAALMQNNIKRLLAYSSIGHVGFMLLGVATGSVAGAQAVIVYLVLYIFMNAGAFACVLLMKRDGVYVESISDLSGLSRTHPAMALLLAAFMFSMAGIPPLSGFFGKMYVILAALEGGFYISAILALIASVIACYYYLRIVKMMYFDAPSAPLDQNAPLALRAGLVITAAVTLLFVLTPAALIDPAAQAAQALLR